MLLSICTPGRGVNGYLGCDAAVTAAFVAGWLVVVAGRVAVVSGGGGVMVAPVARVLVLGPLVTGGTKSAFGLSGFSGLVESAGFVAPTIASFSLWNL